ncbi:MAG: hypothetical protein ACTHK3_08225 [Solirubrobacterales bacterium]
MHLTASLNAVLPALLVGLATSVLAILFLRAASLRWGWALLAAPLVPLLWVIGWQLGLALALASGTAAGIGAY